MDNRYVESIDRDNGIVSLRPLEYELSLLLADRSTQLEIISQLKIQLDDFQTPLQLKVAINLQAWIRCRQEYMIKRYPWIFLNVFYFLGFHEREVREISSDLRNPLITIAFVSCAK